MVGRLARQWQEGTTATLGGNASWQHCAAQHSTRQAVQQQAPAAHLGLSLLQRVLAAGHEIIHSAAAAACTAAAAAAASAGIAAAAARLARPPQQQFDQLAVAVHACHAGRRVPMLVLCLRIGACLRGAAQGRWEGVGNRVAGDVAARSSSSTPSAAPRKHRSQQLSSMPMFHTTTLLLLIWYAAAAVNSACPLCSSTMQTQQQATANHACLFHLQHSPLLPLDWYTAPSTQSGVEKARQNPSAP